MSKKLNYLFVAILLTCFQSVIAQISVVTGKVTDEKGSSMPGVSVVIQGTTKGTATDFDGNYDIEAKKGDVLVFSYIGFTSKKVTVSSKSSKINVILREDTQELDDVIVVGYGTSTKKSLVSSISSVKTEDLKEIPVANVTQGLAGRSPGLIVKSTAGLDNRSKITIRGGGTPLVVIDGIIRSYDDFANILPEDIAEITILKDASSTAVYGARAANGILQVTTVRGSEGKTTIQYSHSTSISSPTLIPNKLDAYE